MIWLTWRQFRAQAAMAAGGLAALAIVLAITGPGLADDYSTGIAACVARSGCSDFFQRFFHANQASWLGVTAAMLVLPALIGLFWGAPLITRELEAGTHRLVWNQSITRTRWLAVKLTLTGLTAMAVAGLGSLAVTWWSGPIDKSAASNSPGFPRMGPLLFDARGIAPIAYAAFAFALGVTIGMLARRTLPAMAITLVAFTVVQIAMPLLVRPHLMPPTRSSLAVTTSSVEDLAVSRGGSIQLSPKAQAPGDPAAWILSNRLVDASGKTIKGTIPVSTSAGPCALAHKPMESAEPCFAELTRLGYRHQLTYQPSSRYWAFQWYETGIFLVLALGLTAFSFWSVRRRLF